MAVLGLTIILIQASSLFPRRRHHFITLFPGHPDFPKSWTCFVRPCSLTRPNGFSQSRIKFFPLVTLLRDSYHTFSLAASTFLSIKSHVSLCRSKQCLSSSSWCLFFSKITSASSPMFIHTPKLSYLLQPVFAIKLQITTFAKIHMHAASLPPNLTPFVYVFCFTCFLHSIRQYCP